MSSQEIARNLNIFTVFRQEVANLFRSFGTTLNRGKFADGRYAYRLVLETIMPKLDLHGETSTDVFYKKATSAVLRKDSRYDLYTEMMSHVNQ